MAPDWEKLGDAFEASSSVVIGNVDCTLDDNKDLCEKYEVRGYPTLKTFEGGVAKDYEGSRDYDGLETFIKVRDSGSLFSRCLRARACVFI
jgi:hypothetical protein